MSYTKTQRARPISMNLDKSTAAIAQDINSLSCLYTLHIELLNKLQWGGCFRKTSINSHKNKQVLFFSTGKITLSGVAIPKESQLDQVYIERGNAATITPGKSQGGLLKTISAFLPVARFFTHKTPKLGDWATTLTFSANTNYKVTARLTDGSEHHIGNIKIVPRTFQLEQRVSLELRQKIKAISHSRTIMNTNIANNRNYLFIIGNARSGTTALLNLLNSSSEVCLGNERYEKFNLAANGYERAEFFDTKSPRFKMREKLYAALEPKFDHAKYIGDKRPGFTADWKNTLLHIPAVKILYIFRHIEGVAASYNERAVNAAEGKDTSWPQRRNFTAAVDDWNFEIQQALLIAEHCDIFFVKYEDIFGSEALMQEVFKSLNIDSEEASIQKLIRNTISRGKSLKTKDRALDAKTLAYIETHADIEAYKKMLALYNQQSPAVPL